MIPPFSISGLPKIIFGDGSLVGVPELLLTMGKRVLIVTGGKSFRSTLHWQGLMDGLKGRGVSWEDMVVEQEPSPGLVDQAVRISPCGYSNCAGDRRRKCAGCSQGDSRVATSW